MPTAKYDWEQVKKDYFVSDFVEVEAFLRSCLGVAPNKPITSDKWARVKGWRQEKEEMKRLQTANAVEKMAEDPEIQEQVKILIKTKANILKSIAMRVNENNKDLSMRELRDALEMVKLELGEPTKIDRLQGDSKNPLVSPLEQIIKELKTKKT